MRPPYLRGAALAGCFVFLTIALAVTGCGGGGSDATLPDRLPDESRVFFAGTYNGTWQSDALAQSGTITNVSITQTGRMTGRFANATLGTEANLTGTAERDGRFVATVGYPNNSVRLSGQIVQFLRARDTGIFSEGVAADFTQRVNGADYRTQFVLTGKVTGSDITIGGIAGPAPVYTLLNERSERDDQGLLHVRGSLISSGVGLPHVAVQYTFLTSSGAPVNTAHEGINLLPSAAIWNFDVVSTRPDAQTYALTGFRTQP